MRVLLFLLGLLGIYSYMRGRRHQPATPRGSLAPRRQRNSEPKHVVYQVVEHDGGWAYQVDGAFSSTYPTREEAESAAENAAAAHEMSGDDAFIEYQDEEGRWHEENESGDDRPEADVETPKTAAAR